jgi:hypothetical protein
MTLEQYIDNINNRYKLGNGTEHTFRGDLQQLLESLVPAISATNEPKRQSCGAPDYILTKKDIPVGYIEAKDIGDKDLEGLKKTGNKEQFDRYKASLNNLIFTDYLAFYLYRDGVFILKIAIAEITDKGIKPLSENFASFENFIKDFCSHIGQTIKSSKKLAEMMAGKARLLSDVIEKALTSDDTNQENSTLKDQMRAFKEILIHDITAKSFADVYAQTIAYGMFAARLHDPTLPTFSRQEAAELIPKSNPFLRKLFGYIAGPDIDDRIKWIVDGLVEIFLACNVEEILKNYGKTTKMEDPIIHFYETFLSEYDPKLRKARGVWYTPHPVVSFQVRAIDEILKTEFGIVQGIADSSKIKTTKNIQGKQVEQEVHKVQMLDPATGTGTYLAEVIRFIHKKFEGQQGIWSNYVENHLLPRLIGFELLMASYAMAHLQIDLLLTETGFKPTKEQRLKIYLTNSLEESHPDTGTLFANWLSSEANEANHVKRDAPVMIVMGNPPYAVSSTNKNPWIQNLIADYKKDLNERKINLDDDYIKFIRYGQHYIDKNGSGILAYISNNSFIDGITHRQMRKNLLESFDKIYILDLHGNSNKKEVCKDGSPDQNVFDIMQGVSINMFIKTGNKKKNELGKVFHFELQGKREFKYEYLNENNFKTIQWQNLEYKTSNFFFVPKDFGLNNKYEKGFKLDELFINNSTGIETQRDEASIHFSKKELEKTIDVFLKNEIEDIRKLLSLEKDGRDWTIKTAKEDLSKGYSITKLQFKPFDDRFIPYTGNSKGIIAYPRNEINQHILKGNYCIVSPRFFKEPPSYFISKVIIGHKILSAYDKNFIFPIYIYPNNTAQQTIEQTTERVPNLNAEIVKQIADKLGLRFVNEKNTSTPLSVTNLSSPNVSLSGVEDNVSLSGVEHNDSLSGIEDNISLSGVEDNVSLSGVEDFAPIDILDYIYAVLHSPTYREKYKEFLKIDFPRVPYPKDKATFWQLVKLGEEIREIHLLESETVEKYITQYPIGGDNVVVKPRFVNNGIANESEAITNKETASFLAVTGKVYINETQYFDNVPQIAWYFYIGGYQPAQKWLKDRKGRTLEFDDILHYQKIIVALTETARLMKEINKIEVE